MRKLSELYHAILNKQVYAAILIGIVCFSVHGVTLLNDYNLDDNLVTQNHRLTSKGISAIPEIYGSPYYQDDMGYSYGYRPTTLASFAIEKSLFGESAMVSHTINLALYLATCLLIFFLVKRVFPDKIDVALFAALLFTVHPIHTEVVASIKNRDEILALLFALAGCFVLIRPQRWWINVLLAFSFFFLSVSSKMSAVNVILMLALIPAYPKPFFKDIVLLALYAISLNFVFEGRDVMNDNSERNVLSFVSLFFILRLTSSSGDKIKRVISTLAAFTTLIKSAWSKVKKNLFSTVRYTTFEEIQIIVGSFATYWIVNDSLGELQENLFLITVIGSFLFLRTDKPDIFFRLSIIPLGLDFNSEFKIFLLLGFMIRLYESSYTKYVLKSLVIIAIGNVLQYYWFEITNIVGNAAFVFVLFSIAHYRRLQIMWVLLALSTTCVISLIIESILLDPWFSPAEILTIFSMLITTSFMVRGRLSPLFFKKIIGNQLLTKPIPISNLLIGFLFLPLTFLTVTTFLSDEVSSKLIVEYDTTIQKSILQSEKSVKSFFGYLDAPDIVEPWSSKLAKSWKRPFDFIEHPLSPFATTDFKYGTAAITLNRYLGKLFIPYPLAFYYGYDEITIDGLFSLRSLFSISVHLFILFIGFYYRKTNSILSIGIFLYLTSIILFSGAVEIVAGMFADRFSYTASFGFCLTIAAGFKLLVENLNQTARLSYTTLGIILLLSFSAYSFQRNKLWKNKLTLMTKDIKSVPNSAQANNLLAHAIMENVFVDNTFSNNELGSIKQAATHFARATDIYPFFFNAWVDLAKVNSLLGNQDLALKANIRAHNIDETYSPVIASIAETYESLGDTENAILYYRKYIAIAPQKFAAYDNLARILFQEERYSESADICKTYLKIDPNNSGFRQNLSILQNLLNDSSTIGGLDETP
jgi:tetratricopeptide (TPR) repeat protein